MDRKFGARQPTGTPSLAWSCLVVIVSLLAGASVVHNIYKPNLVITAPPPFDSGQCFQDYEHPQGVRRNRLPVLENADAVKKNQAENKE